MAKTRFIAKRVTPAEQKMLTFVSDVAAIPPGDVLLLGLNTVCALSQAVAELTTDCRERRETFKEVLSARDDGEIVRLEAEAALASVRHRIGLARRLRRSGNEVRV